MLLMAWVARIKQQIYFFNLIGSRVWAVALLKNIKANKKVIVPVYVAPTWRLDRSSDPNQIW